MKQYDSYKDSGVEWIGEVPSHWIVVPFKRAIMINNGCDYKHVQVEEDGYPVIGSGVSSLGQVSICMMVKLFC